VGHPGILLLLGAVGVGIGRRVAGVAVGDGLQKDRALLVFQDLELSGHGLDHGHRVVAIDPFGMHLVRVDTGADAGDKVIAHGLAAGLATHRVLVVHDVEHQGQAALHLVIPEQAVLVHRRQHQAFPDRAAGHRAVADIGDDHARLAVDFLIQGRADRDVSRATDNGVVGVDAKRQEEGMHRAAQALVEAGLLGKDLGQRAVDEEIDRQLTHRLALAFVGLFDDFPGGTIEEALHDCQQIRLAHLVDRGQALGQDLAVASVGTEDEVLMGQVVGLADRGGLLAHREVRRAGVVVLEAIVGIGGLDRIQHRLEFADDPHVAVDPQKVSLGEIVLLFGRLFLVLVDRDVLEGDLAGGADFFGFDEQLLGHGWVSFVSISRPCWTGLHFTQFQWKIASRMISATVGCGKMSSLIASSRISDSTRMPADRMISEA